MTKYFMIVALSLGSIALSFAQPSDQRVKDIILSKTKDVIPESIKLSSTGGTPIKQLSGLVHWKRSASFIGKTEVGRKKYSVDVHVDHNYEFIKFTWGDVIYLDMEAPDFSSIEEVINTMAKAFVGGLDGKIREVKSIRFENSDPDAITWSDGGKEVTLKFRVTFIADGRYQYQERWLAEQIVPVRFFRVSTDSKNFLDNRLYIAKRNKRTDIELLKTLSIEDAKKVRWDDNVNEVPSIKWNE